MGGWGCLYTKFLKVNYSFNKIYKIVINSVFLIGLFTQRKRQKKMPLFICVEDMYSILHI